MDENRHAQLLRIGEDAVENGIGPTAMPLRGRSAALRVKPLFGVLSKARCHYRIVARGSASAATSLTGEAGATNLPTFLRTAAEASLIFALCFVLPAIFGGA